MQTSQGFIVMLILVTSTFAPVLSTPLQCVVVPFIPLNTADLFVVLVGPKNCAAGTNFSIVTTSRRL
jgi:hypothetical protein